MSKILITGGAGFIGANLASHLVGTGYDVTVLDNFSRGRREYLAGLPVRIVETDILDPDTLAASLAGAEGVVHLAAYGSVVESVENPLPNFEINGRGTLNVLHAARLNGVRKFVFASTGGAIMGNTPPPVNEDSLPRPISPYGASKLVGEGYLHAFAKSYGIQTVATRFANVYGPLSGHKKGAVTAFMKSVMSGDPISIYGDGSASRDFIHVDDLCNGIRLALETNVPGGSIYHLASGVETSVSTLLDEILAVADAADHPVRWLDKRIGEVERNFASFDKAKRDLGFQPKISLREGLGSTWTWFSSEGRDVLDMTSSDS